MRNRAGSEVSQEGQITGSPLYMSPEQAMGDHEPDARSDIYSLGAVAYFMLTGRPPFADDNAMRVIIAHASQPPAPLSDLRPDISGDLERVVMRCLAKDPAARYQSAVALREALDLLTDVETWGRAEAEAWWLDPAITQHTRRRDLRTAAHP